MSLSGGQACLKYTLFAINLLFCILGAVLLGIGIWVHVDSASMEEALRLVQDETGSKEKLETPAVVEQAPIVIIVAGAIVFVISFLGCCGAIKEWRVMLVIYAIFLFILSVMDLAAAIAIAVFNNKIPELVPDALNKTLVDHYYGETPDDATKIDLSWPFDIMQAELKCCGIKDHTDFRQKAVNWVDISTKVIPESCCVLSNEDTYALNDFQPKDSDCVTNPTTSNSYRDNGCQDDLIDVIDKYSLIIMGIGIAVGLLQLIGCIVACVLCRAIGKAENSV